jgi:hypothetical protein
VRINGTIEVHTEGTYYIEWRDRGKRCRASVTRKDAVDQAGRKAIELRAMREGLITNPEPEPEASPKTTIGDANRRLSPVCADAAQGANPSDISLYPRYAVAEILQKKIVEDPSRDDVLDFMTYCYEQGLEVPLPASQVERLRKLKEAREATPNQLVFPNGRGKPDSEMDMVVKLVAQRAGLNCKQCVTEHGNKRAEGPYCMNFFLHKFRHAFATNHLRDGVDIRTVQAWLGHRDIKSTMVYLKGIRSKDAAQKVNSGELAALVA